MNIDNLVEKIAVELCPIKVAYVSPKTMEMYRAKARRVLGVVGAEIWRDGWDYGVIDKRNWDKSLDHAWKLTPNPFKVCPECHMEIVHKMDCSRRA